MQQHRAILKLGAPIAIGQLGTIVLTFADTMMVGRYGTPELAAASFVNSVFNLVTMIILGYSYGLTPTIAHHVGRGEHALAGEALRCGVRSNFYFGSALLAVFGLLYFALDHLGQPPELLPLIRPYYLVVWASMWWVVVFSVVRQFADATGRTQLAMWLLLGGNVVNIVGNALLIFGLGPFSEWGLLGAGVATLVSRVLVALALVGIVGWHPSFAPYRRRAAQALVSVRAIHRQSWPVAAQLGLETSAFTFSGVMAGWIGAIPLAAYQVLIALGTLGFTLYYSFASSMSIRMSHFLGQHDLPSVNAAARAGRNILLGNALVSSLVFWLGGASLLSLFTPDPAVVALAAALLPLLVLYQFADAMQICYANALRAVGNVRPMMWIALVAYLGVGIPAGYLLAFTFGFALHGLYFAFTLCLFVAACLFYRYFRQTVGKMADGVG